MCEYTRWATKPVYGTWVIITLYKVKSLSKKLATLKRNKMIKFSLVLVVCTASLLFMCGFLLYSTISQSMSAVGAIIFVFVVEILPLTLLIFTVYSKRKSVFRLWYSHAVTRGSSHLSTSAGFTTGSDSVNQSTSQDLDDNEDEIVRK